MNGFLLMEPDDVDEHAYDSGWSMIVQEQTNRARKAEIRLSKAKDEIRALRKSLTNAQAQHNRNQSDLVEALLTVNALRIRNNDLREEVERLRPLKRKMQELEAVVAEGAAAAHDDDNDNEEEGKENKKLVRGPKNIDPRDTKPLQANITFKRSAPGSAE